MPKIRVARFSTPRALSGTVTRAPVRTIATLLLLVIKYWSLLLIIINIIIINIITIIVIIIIMIIIVHTVQEYMVNPMLLENRKFAVRIYMLVARVKCRPQLYIVGWHGYPDAANISNASGT